jgi:hypothetical protein
MTYAEATREQWKHLVRLALTIPDRDYEGHIRRLAGEVGQTFGVLKRKCDAIRHEHEKGLSEESIVSLGQGVILASYIKARKKAVGEKTRMLVCRIPASMYDAIQNAHASPDQEEALMTRLNRLLGIRTWEEFWNFNLSVFATATDDEILHQGGEHPGKRKRKR